MRLAPGVRLNISKKSVSLSLGKRGVGINIGPRGVYGRVGLPGTGLSYRERLDRPRTSTAATDGRAQHEQQIAELKQQLADFEQEQQALLLPHLATPAPALATMPPLPPQPFSQPRPIAPEADADQTEYRLAMGRWRAAKANHETAQQTQRQLHAKVQHGEPAAMEQQLESALARIEWPRETLIDFQFVADTLYLDVDLPEIEDMPQETLVLRQREAELVTQPKTATAVRKDYMQHVHSIALRIVGEAFGVLPTLRRVVISGYSQRRSRATGAIEDEYLYSARIERNDWQRIDFTQLSKIDPVAALDRFELRRKMSATGVFQPIAPFVAD